MLFSVFALMLIGTSNASADTVKQEETLSTQASERAATIAPEFCGYLFLVLQKKEGSTWTVRVYGQNPKASYNIAFQYCDHMAFTNDAKEWKNLKSNYIKTITTGIPAFNGVNIEIKENWFADAIAVSYECADGYRYITYANMLDRFNWTLDQYTAKVPLN